MGIKKKRTKKLFKKGFTLIELLIVAAVIGILLAIAIPNLFKARMSANEANAKKSLQTLRDAEGEYSEQDLDGNGIRDYINIIGDLGISPSLRNPSGTGLESDALVDPSLQSAQVSIQGVPDCLDPKAGYCIQFDIANILPNASGLFEDFGWQVSMISYNRVGRRDYAVYGDGSIRCVTSGASDPSDLTSSTTLTVGDPGEFTASRVSPSCD